MQVYYEIYTKANSETKKKKRTLKSYFLLLTTIIFKVSYFSRTMFKYSWKPLKYYFRLKSFNFRPSKILTLITKNYPQ